MLLKILILSFIFSLAAALIRAETAAKTTADREFERLANEFIQKMLELNPEDATQLGDHRYDDRLNDVSRAGIERSRRFNQDFLTKLKAIDFAKLSKVNNVDARILRDNLEYNLFQLDVLREYEWNPLVYNKGAAINNLIARDFAPLESRLNNVRLRLEQIPTVIAAAKANLKNPPRVYTETAIAQNAGVVNLIRGDVQMFADRTAPEVRAALAPAQARAVAALEEYGKWLKDDLLPRSNGDFRLGDAKYRQKLKFALESDLPKEELLKRAEADLKRTQDEMLEIAVSLYPKYFPADADAAKTSTDKKSVIKKILDKLAESRPTNADILSQASDDVRETTDFVRAKNLVTVPTEPLKVIEMPEFQRGFSVAYFDSAGVFEKRNETFYAISPTPKDWDARRAESFYREYNDFMLKNLTVHEAMPGHYLQIMHSNRFTAPTKIRAIFSSGSFVEGWAMYAEQLMAEHGYGGAEVRLHQLKFKLRCIINSILDQKIHTAGMTEKEAIALMMNEGFQEEGEAVGKWKRAQLSSTQLSTYYVGLVEVNDLRRAYEAKRAGKIDVQKMHDEMLSFGSPAAKYVKEMMNL